MSKGSRQKKTAYFEEIVIEGVLLLVSKKVRGCHTQMSKFYVFVKPKAELCSY